MVFVAVDDDGRPTAVPELPDGDDEDLAQKHAAVRRIDLRAQIAAAMAEQSYTDASTAPKVVLRFLAAPNDVNWGGKVHGGIVMRWIDEAAHVLVTEWTGDAANIAVYAGGVRFYQPLRIGDLVEVEARLIYTGRRSMHVSVHVRSGNPAVSGAAPDDALPHRVRRPRTRGNGGRGPALGADHGGGRPPVRAREAPHRPPGGRRRHHPDLSGRRPDSGNNARWKQGRPGQRRQR